MNLVAAGFSTRLSRKKPRSLIPRGFKIIGRILSFHHHDLAHLAEIRGLHPDEINAPWQIRKLEGRADDSISALPLRFHPV